MAAGGRALFECLLVRAHAQANSEYRNCYIGRTQRCGAKLMVREGNNPDCRQRPLNHDSVSKEVMLPKHLEGRLRSSHP